MKHCIYRSFYGSVFVSLHLPGPNATAPTSGHKTATRPPHVVIANLWRFCDVCRRINTAETQPYLHESKPINYESCSLNSSYQLEIIVPKINIPQPMFYNNYLNMNCTR